MARFDRTRVPSGTERPLLEWLLLRYPETPKTRAKQWVQAGRVSVAGKVLRKPHELIPDPGNDLRLLDRHAQSLLCGSGWQIHPRVELLFLDGSLAVVNKGAGLISVPAPNVELSALSILTDFLAGHIRAQERSVAGRTLPAAYRKLRPLPVHRLDQYTSGVFCLAMNPLARQSLIAQVSVHSMKREYVAFVEGRPAQAHGTWRHWLEFNEVEWREQVVDAERAAAGRTEAQEAITHYEVIAEYALPANQGFISKLRLKLETGRKHQIRAQAAHAGLPLIGDRTYHPKYQPLSHLSPPVPFARQALHAEVLALEHPDRPGETMTWTARPPKDLRELEAALRAGLRSD
jgi:23S rRNA pseudouridine1911/1915/1917 synthase